MSKFEDTEEYECIEEETEESQVELIQGYFEHISNLAKKSVNSKNVQELDINITAIGIYVDLIKEDLAIINKYL